jgi:hypothetical protein
VDTVGAATDERYHCCGSSIIMMITMTVWRRIDEWAQARMLTIVWVQQSQQRHERFHGIEE